MTHAEILQRITRIQRELAELAEQVATGASALPPLIPSPDGPWPNPSAPPPGGFAIVAYMAQMPSPGDGFSSSTIVITSTPPPDYSGLVGPWPPTKGET